MLAMADDEWMDLATAQSVLESWFVVPFSPMELHRLLCALTNHEFVLCKVNGQTTNKAVQHLPNDISLVEFKATDKGIRYFSENNGTDVV